MYDFVLIATGRVVASTKVVGPNDRLQVVFDDDEFQALWGGVPHSFDAPIGYEDDAGDDVYERHEVTMQSNPGLYMQELDRWLFDRGYRVQKQNPGWKKAKKKTSSV